MKYDKGYVLSYMVLAGAVLLNACSTTNTTKEQALSFVGEDGKADAGVKESIVLLPSEDGMIGAVVIGGEQQRTTILDTPLAGARIDRQGRIKTGTVTEESVRQTFASALATQPPKPASFILYFLATSMEIMPSSQATLEALLAEVAKRQAVEVQITGHTDRVGSVADNDRLSLMRAEAVRDILVKNGLQASFIRAVGRGEREPLIPTPDEQPEPQNRRVEVIVR